MKGYEDECRVYWGTHGCCLPRGHDGPHRCTCADDPEEPGILNVGAPPYSEKRKKITEAAYPIPGLMFDTAGGVVLNGIPFEQCSSAEQLRVSVAIGLALNPKLKVLLIRDGSLLDDDSLREIQAIAEKADAQIWMERVGVDGQTSVVIEDGKIV
jgi:hypothetical protein